MGDAGYLDDQGRLWYCGRTSHRVETSNGVLYSVPVEQVFNGHADVHRTALVGVGDCGAETPVLIVEPAHATNGDQRHGTRASDLIAQLRQVGQEHALTQEIHDFRIRSPLPTDVRHNAKIAREEIKAMLQRQTL
jgi:acyl-coenzyme A synthetase/AMP-(fatty) acid ligase